MSGRWLHSRSRSTCGWSMGATWRPSCTGKNVTSAVKAFTCFQPAALGKNRSIVGPALLMCLFNRHTAAETKSHML